MSQNDLSGLNVSKVERRQPGTWREAFLAGLPHLLMGLLIGLERFSVLDVTNVSQPIGLFVGILGATLVCGVLVFAITRGWPLWSASWYLYGGWVFTAVLGLTIKQMDLDESWRYTNAIFLGWIAVCIVGYFLILSKSKLHALLTIAFFFPLLGVMTLEFIPNPIEGWLAIIIGMLAALMAGIIIRLGELNLALGIVLIFNFITGMILAYISEYKMLDLPPGMSQHTPRFDNFIEMLVIYSLISLGIIAIPFILRKLWQIGSRRLAP